MTAARWRARFGEATTGVAFALTLSKRMVEQLAVIALRTEFEKRFEQSIDPDRRGQPPPILHNSAIGALDRRGLIEWKLDPARLRLTPAGELVFELLELADLIPAFYRSSLQELTAGEAS